MFIRMIHALIWLPLCVCSIALSTQTQANQAVPWVVIDRLELKPPIADHTAAIELEAVLIEGVGWQEAEVTEAILAASKILQQCGVRLARLQTTRVRVSADYRHLHTPYSRRLAAGLAIGRPALFFVDDTRHQPAFDAEAFGTGNTRSRPELRHTAWFTRATPHLASAIAHELFHVLADSGAHHSDVGNLMFPETAANRHRLDPPQCAKLLEESRKNNLLREH